MPTNTIPENLAQTPPNGIECDLKVGDTVTYTNEFGVVWPNHKVIGFSSPDDWYHKKYPEHFILIDTDAHWFPKRRNELTTP